MDNARKTFMEAVVKGLFGGEPTTYGLLVNGTVPEETRSLLGRKGFLVRGASAENSEVMVVLGPLAHAIPSTVDQNIIPALHRMAGAVLLPTDVETLHERLGEMPDEVPPEYFPEMQSLVDAVNQIAQEGTLTPPKKKEQEKVGVCKAEEEGSHGERLCIGAILPNGKVIEAHICRHCAMEFVEGRSDGEQYARADLMRLLLAFVIGHADEMRVEDTVERELYKVFTKH